MLLGICGGEAIVKRCMAASRQFVTPLSGWVTRFAPAAALPLSFDHAILVTLSPDDPQNR